MRGRPVAQPAAASSAHLIFDIFLGATAISPGRFDVIGTVLGLLFVQSSVSGLALSTSATWVSSVFNGVALIAAVFLSSALRRREGADT